jgi:hypothetical protein
MESWALDIYLPHILKFTPLRWQDSVILIKKKKNPRDFKRETLKDESFIDRWINIILGSIELVDVVLRLD